MAERTVATRPSHDPPGTAALPSGGPFRIATVAELTSVPVATLRAWERRYGIPTPERTASGYRLYGALEVAQVSEMKRLCEEGMAAAEAAQAVSSRRERAAQAGTDERQGLAPADAYATSTAAILEAVTRLDDAALDHELRRLLLLGGAAHTLDRVVTPALRTIGDLWHAGELSVAQEHFATQKLGTLIRDLVRLAARPDPTAAVVLAAFADETHDVGLLGLALRLSEWGMQPIFLGASTPPSAIRSAVETATPKLVALSVTVTPTRPRARELVEEYAAACGDVAWMVGGTGAPAIADLVTKHGGAVAPEDPTELRRLVQSLVARAAPREARTRRRT